MFLEGNEGIKLTVQLACRKLDVHLETHLSSLALTASVPKSQTHALKQDSDISLYVLKKDLETT